MCKYAHVHTCAHQACIPWAALALESKPCTAPGRPLCSWLAVSPPCRCDPSWPAGTRRPAPWGRGSVLDRQWEVSRNPGVIGWGAGSIGAHAPLPHPRPPSPSPCSLLLGGKDLRSGSQRAPLGRETHLCAGCQTAAAARSSGRGQCQCRGPPGCRALGGSWAGGSWGRCGGRGSWV